VLLAALIAYLAALTAWRRQQRREVYGAYIAAVDDVLDSLDLLLDEGGEAQLRHLDGWGQFHRARIKFDAAWGQARLVAPTRLAEHADSTGYALLNFERCAKSLTVSAAQVERKKSPFLGWEKAKEFVAAARDDLGVESRILARWSRHRERLSEELDAGNGSGGAQAVRQRSVGGANPSGHGGRDCS
jgi:hypothetical protein